MSLCIKHIGLLTITEDAQRRVYSGPKTIIDRLKWERFGEAAKSKNKSCTTVGDEVEFELVSPELKKRYQKKTYCSTYISIASKYEWSKADINAIRESEDPQKTFYHIFDRNQATISAEIRSKYAPKIAEIEAAYSAAIAEYTKTQKPADTSPAEEAVQVPAPTQSIGIRGRFSSKIAERKKQEEASDSKAAPATIGLAARMKSIKQESCDSEQESTLFISNLAEISDESDLRAILGDRFRCKRINVVRKMVNGERTHKGAAFVVLSSQEEAGRCMEFLNGYRLHNLILSADFSKPRSND
jgi:hypothetical protein